jgi:hypothetical protein
MVQQTPSFRQSVLRDAQYLIASLARCLFTANASVSLERAESIPAEKDIDTLCCCVCDNEG